MTASGATQASERTLGSAGAWIARIVVLGGLAATLWMFGPEAWAVVLHRLGSSSPPERTLDMRRVGLVRAPRWLRGDLATAVLKDLEPRLAPERALVGIRDRDAARALRDRLRASAFVRKAEIQPQFPDRWRVDLELNRPVLEVVAADELVALVDAEGVALPAPEKAIGLPRAVVHHGVGSGWRRRITPGQVFPDRRVLASVDVVSEWAEVTAGVAGAPALHQVDASNLDWAYIADPNETEIRIEVRCADGGLANLRYGRAERSEGFVTVATKRRVLRAMLEKYPGLEGIAGGDLRLRNLWEDYLVERPQ